jgi:2,4-dienoyl-CoA reductase-like NADH-dependent reductase (Old Yellow Enzyme family)
MSNLFSSLRLNSKHEFQNRLAVAPMTTSQSNPDGTISEDEVRWLERLASDDYGLVITCAAAISKKSIAFHNQMSVANEDMLPGLTLLEKQLNKYRSKTVIQLCHAGSRAIPGLTGTLAYSASSYTMSSIPNFVSPKTLSSEQIDEIIEDFANACERVEKAGFDGIEFHGANGYLFTQFISKMTNLRHDEYGGSLVNRTRFSREVVKVCRKRVQKNFIIGFRITMENGWLETGLDIDENIQIINWLKEDGIDYIHISHLFFDAASTKYPYKIALQYICQNINPDLPLICAGSITNIDSANKALEYGASMVAIGRAAIGNDKLPEYFALGKALPFTTPFTTDNLRKAAVSDKFIHYITSPGPLSNMNIIRQ